jgi:hypothetical protein
MFLSDDELAKLTGRPQKSKQIAWLRSRLDQCLEHRWSPMLIEQICRKELQK